MLPFVRLLDPLSATTLLGRVYFPYVVPWETQLKHKTSILLFTLMRDGFYSCSLEKILPTSIHQLFNKTHFLDMNTSEWVQSVQFLVKVVEARRAKNMAQKQLVKHEILVTSQSVLLLV